MMRDDAVKAIDEAFGDALKQEFDFLRTNIHIDASEFKKLNPKAATPQQAFAAGLKNLIDARAAAITILGEVRWDDIGP